MDSRFAHLRQRDASVSMLRVKMSRRRSQSQKENRHRAVNARRQLDKLPEMDVSSLDASIAIANMSISKEKILNTGKTAKDKAVEERLKQLERWKERKALEKEKEKREKERKGVFKTGIYHPKDTLNIVPLAVVQPASTRAKEAKANTTVPQSSRVTRSMKQQVQKPLKTQNSNAATKEAQPPVERSSRSRAAPVKTAAPSSTKTKVCPVEPAVRAPSTRSASRPPVTAAPAPTDKPKDKPADVRTTRSRAFINPVAPPSDKEVNSKAARISNPTSQLSVPEEPEEDEMMDQAEAKSSVPSFAPKDFIFQAPTGLSSFKFDPLTPRSADAFLTPCNSFTLPPPPLFNEEAQAEQSGPSPSKSPRRSPQHTSPTEALPTPGSPLESKHDVPYFRSEIRNETNRLTSLSDLWEPKVEDESIPEEMRDRMRTAVGQARLLMKERFNQFSGLVDDCELGRGEKITTCTDLQGFWDMVYYQVEDVNKKFDALKEAESRGWVEEQKPQPRQRKVVKKQSAVPAKPAGTKAAAKSRLAAVKAAMKAKQQAAEAEKAAKDAGTNEEGQSQSSQETQPQTVEAVVFDGGFFQVESPAKTPGPTRRSSRLSAALLPQASPCSNYLSPRRVTRRSLALAQTPLQVTASSPAQKAHTPVLLRLTLDQTPAQAPKSHRGTPKSSRKTKDTPNDSLCFSPIKEALPADNQTEGSPVPTQEKPAIALPPVLSLSSVTVVEEQGEPAQPPDVDPLVPPRISLSPRKTPRALEPSSSVSFMLSPCAYPSQPPISCPPAVETQDNVCHTPDSSLVEEIPGLDFERYLQPSQRCSMSPRETPAIETPSPMAVDVEMESPRGQAEDLLTPQEPALPALHSVLSLQSPQVQTAQSDMLLFTPDLKDRIRQSVCPSDLMVFTPPPDL